MSFETTRKLIADALDAITFPFPIGWENNKPAGPADAWGRFAILQGTTLPAVIGPGHTRAEGEVVLQVFLKENTGTKAASDAADTLSAALDRVQLSDAGTTVTFDLVSMVDAGRRDGYTQKNLWCKFTRDTYG